jgi:hypothetical protein
MAVPEYEGQPFLSFIKWYVNRDREGKLSHFFLICLDSYVFITRKGIYNKIMLPLSIFGEIALEQRFGNKNNRMGNSLAQAVPHTFLTGRTLVKSAFE